MKRLVGLAALAAAISVIASQHPGAAQTSPTSGGSVEPAIIEDLVVANRILADQGVLDGLGHVSIRHPTDPNRYLMSRSLAPALVAADDVMEYDLDSNPIDARGRSSFIERFIHGEIYKARPDVMAVIHSHSPSVIPFGISQVPMKATYAMASFLAAGVPVFDIRKAGGAGELLVRNAQFGKALAETLGDKNVVLMRGHGEVVVATSLQMVVLRGIYTEINARLQMQAIMLGGPSPISIWKKDKKTKPTWRWRRLGLGSSGSAQCWRRCQPNNQGAYSQIELAACGLLNARFPAIGSGSGHSRPMHSVPVPINVRCYSNSDIIVRRSEVTLSARRRHRTYRGPTEVACLCLAAEQAAWEQPLTPL